MSQISDDVMAFLNVTTNWKMAIRRQRALPSDSLLFSPPLSLYIRLPLFFSLTPSPRVLLCNWNPLTDEWLFVFF